MRGLQAIAGLFFLPATTMTITFAEFDHTLRDGRVVHVREMRPEDEGEFVQTFDRLSPDARYMRFMRFVKAPDMKRLREVLGSLHEHGFGLVATVPAADGYDIVGSAIYFLGKDPSVCEFATTVAGDFAGAADPVAGILYAFRRGAPDRKQNWTLLEIKKFIHLWHHLRITTI